MVFETIAYTNSAIPATPVIVGRGRRLPPTGRPSDVGASQGEAFTSPSPGTGSVLYFVVLMDIQKSLSQLGDRISRAREDLRIVEEQLLFQMDVLEEAKTRMLVAETPLADREFRVAREDHDRLVEERNRVGREIAELQREQDRLLDRMLASPPV